MVMRVDRVVQRIAQEGREIMREAIRINTLALDQAGIAEGCLFTGLAPVNEQDRPAPLLEVQRNRDPDDPGSQHSNIDFHEGSAVPEPCLLPPGV
jgi:hypothetical protein